MRRDRADEGRVRRPAGPVVVAAMAMALGLVWLLDRGASVEAPTGGAGVATLGVPELGGRLVYPTFEAAGPPDRQQRLWVLDLATGRLSEGPLVPTAEELRPAGPDGSGVLVVTGLGRGGAAVYLVEDLAPGARPIEVAHGDLLSLSSRSDAVVVARTRPTAGRRCPGSRYRLTRVPLHGPGDLVARGRVSCGRVLSVVGIGDRVYASVLRRDGPVTGVAADGRLDEQRVGLVLVSAGPDGARLGVAPDAGLVRSFGVWPATPTGALVLHGSRTAAGRPLVRDVRLFAERVVAWSDDGSAVVVSGIVGGERSLWLVDAEEGSVSPLLPANAVPVRSAFSGADFANDGTLFVGALGTILVSTPAGLVPLHLPPGAPSPAGPVAWLP